MYDTYYLRAPEIYEPEILPSNSDDCTPWENRPPAWKGSSTKGGNNSKEIAKRRKKTKNNKTHRKSH